jgi:hypothetical protein
MCCWVLPIACLRSSEGVSGTFTTGYLASAFTGRAGDSQDGVVAAHRCGS